MTIAMTKAVYDINWLARVKARTVVDVEGCWIWQGHCDPNWGYGRTCYRKTGVTCHRRTYEILHGVKLGRWEFVCHKCDKPACCRPDCLFLGTPHDNILDSAIKGRHHNVRKTHCKAGHEYTPENTYIKPDDGARSCKTCARIRGRAAWHADPMKRQKQREWRDRRRLQS